MSEKPIITVNATLSCATLSLANAKESSIEITLELRLTRSIRPLTLYIPLTFFDADAQHSHDSAYYLEDSKGTELPRAKMNFLPAQDLLIDPEKDLITLEPGKVIEITQRIGIHSLQESDSDEEQLSICATSLDELTAGHNYNIRLGGQQTIFWWWSFASENEVMKSNVGIWNRLLGRKTFTDKLIGSGSGGVFGFQMLNQPEIKVEA